MTPEPTALADLVTLRDWLRYGVSRFNAAALVYGHGTASALDEAAFIILSALELPIDQLDPWLDARLTMDERRGVLDLIETRITSRKPAAYLVGKAWIKDYSFRIDERVIVPRSYIGELLIERPDALVGDAAGVGRVLDLCTGSGCLAILAASTFPEAHVDAVDLSPDALAVARYNIADYGLDQRVAAIESDLFAGLAGRRYDFILSNPPYVTTEAVAAFPPEYRSEPTLAHHGGADGMDLVRRILDQAGDYLTPGGTLVVEIGLGRDVIERDYPDLAILWLDTEDSEGEVMLIMAEHLATGSVARGGGKRARRKDGVK